MIVRVSPARGGFGSKSTREMCRMCSFSMGFSQNFSGLEPGTARSSSSRIFGLEKMEAVARAGDRRRRERSFIVDGGFEGDGGFVVEMEFVICWELL